MQMETFRFVDLFAGLGGFHVALQSLGGRCVFASEIDETLRDCYQQNFGILPSGDLRKVPAVSVPDHDILCAGFPCQPFSKAGEQLGFECTQQGDLFDFVAKILRAKRPRFLILENVPNILRHDEGKTYAKIRSRLERLGYDVRESRLSPHQFGIPQIRERAYIVGCRSGLNGFSWPRASHHETSIESALEDRPGDARPLPTHIVECLNVWNAFLKAAPKNVELPWFPMWSMEWGADYPYEDETPLSVGNRALAKHRGSHGIVLRNIRPDDRIEALPSYARAEKVRFPGWKVNFIKLNRAFYATNRRWIDPWMPLILKFPASFQKLEWHAKGGARDIWKYVIQCRASGVRVKRMAHAPSLIAMTTSQVPIISWQKRFMTPRECARLQSLSSLKNLPVDTRAFKALGNAVNAKVVRKVAKALIESPAKRSASAARRSSGVQSQQEARL